MEKTNRIAVFFPGIGYTCDRPLLYYASKIALSLGYEVKRLSYSGMPSGVKGDPQKMQQVIDLGIAQAKEQLSGIRWQGYDSILLVGKSVGTVIAAYYAAQYQLNAHQIAFTPLMETFRYAPQGTLAFHGTKDPWVHTAEIVEACESRRIPLYLTAGANHSLETGDLRTDLDTLQKTMIRVESYITAKTSGKRTVRQCTGKDLVTMTELYNHVVWYLDKHVNYPKWIYNDYPGYETVRLALQKGILYGCFEEDVCVGGMILDQDPQGDYSPGKWSHPYTPEEYMVIHTLAVSPDLTNRGVGAYMIDFAMEEARRRGLKAVRADAVPGNIPARNLLEKCGFTCVGEYDLKRDIKRIPEFALYEKEF